MSGYLSRLVNRYINLKTVKSNNPVLVLESDDWGSLRTQDLATLQRLRKISTAIDSDSYTMLDSIARQEDLDALYEVLSSVRDKNSNPAKLTANVSTANPDFRFINSSRFRDFAYEPFTKTLDDYSNGSSLLGAWKKGISEGLFKPQLHGREHVHALAWLNELRLGNKDLLKAFELNSFGIPYKAIGFQKRSNLQAALDTYNINGEEVYHQNWINDSINIFEQTFNYSPTSFIAPAYIWNSDIESILASNGIQGLQGIKLQYSPSPLNSPTRLYRKKIHFTGEVNSKSGLIYTNRNVFIEVHSGKQMDWENLAMSRISSLLNAGIPVIISMHRVNFVGRLSTNHRDESLRILKNVLKKVTSMYPDIEFLSSDELTLRLRTLID